MNNADKLKEFFFYAKKFFVALGVALGILAAALSDGTVSTAEWVQIAIGFLGAAGVYKATNETEQEL
jgi:hypothetical protein